MTNGELEFSKGRDRIGRDLYAVYTKLQRSLAEQIYWPKLKTWRCDVFRYYFMHSIIRARHDILTLASNISSLSADRICAIAKVLNLAEDNTRMVSMCLYEQASRMFSGLSTIEHFFAQLPYDATLEDAVEGSDSDVQAMLLHHMSRFSWPLLFVVPYEETCITEPPALEYVESQFGHHSIYLPTLFPSELRLRDSWLRESSFKRVIDFVHKKSASGNTQQLIRGAIDGGVAAFDNRVVADYRRIATTPEAQIYDILMGAISGMQIRIANKDRPDVDMLLVICSPLAHFFNIISSPIHTKWMDVIASEPALYLLDRTDQELMPEEQPGGGIVMVEGSKSNDRLKNLSSSIRNIVDELEIPAIGCQLSDLWRRRLMPMPSKITNIPYIKKSSRDIKEQLRYIVGSSKVMQELREEITAIAETNPRCVTIQGETGSGKELVARALHGLCRESQGKFERFISRGSTNVMLLESEANLFGVRRVASNNRRNRLVDSFGNMSPQVGLLERSDVSTVFFDDFKWPIDAQEPFLKLIESGEYNPIGGTNTITNQLLLFAQNTPLGDLVLRNELRPDVLTRLLSPSIVVPPLSKHIEDIPEIIDFWRDLTDEEIQIIGANRQHSLSWMKAIDNSVIDALMDCNWDKQNVRVLLQVLSSCRIQARKSLTESKINLDVLRATLQQPQYAPLRTRIECADEPTLDWSVRLSPALQQKFKQVKNEFNKSNINLDSLESIHNSTVQLLNDSKLTVNYLLTAEEASEVLEALGGRIAARTIAGRQQKEYGAVKWNSRLYFIPQVLELVYKKKNQKTGK